MTSNDATNPKQSMIEVLLAEDVGTIASVAKHKHKEHHLGCNFEPRLARNPEKRREPTCPALEETFEDTLMEAAETLLQPTRSAYRAR